MKIDLNTKDNVTVFIIRGRLDAVAATQVKARLEILSEPDRKMVIDMDQVEFIDSSGLGALIACLRRFRKINGDIKLACLNSNVRQVFELTRAFRLFDIFDSSTAAVESISQEAAA